ncbi:MAG TPA: tripartite tricarboxylate transporter substrate binding protein [Spirochaetia bacterium]|nr:tripartite tricarboxylate transporter substrate binding protein [Spirochaetia bacterium]
MKKSLLILFILLAVTSLVFGSGGKEGPAAKEAAPEYPNKAVQIIVPWGAGGRTDINARMFASVAPKYLGQPVVVINKAGGASVIGGDFVAKSNPDGYTLLAITPGTNVFPPVFKKAPYTTYDFDPIGQIGSSTMVIASSPNKPWKDVQGLIEYAKSHPGELTFSCAALSAPHLGFLRWADKAGLEFKFVPITASDAQAVENALGEHVDMAMVSSIATVLSHVKAGKLIPLMTFGENRDPALPNTPTAKELGFDVVASPFTGLAGPKGMPKEVLEKLRTVFKQVIEDEDFLKLMQRIGEDVNPKYGDDFFAVWKNDFEGYSAVVKKMGLAQ